MSIQTIYEGNSFLNPLNAMTSHNNYVDLLCLKRCEKATFLCLYFIFEFHVVFILVVVAVDI